MTSNRVWAGVALVALFAGVSDAVGPHCAAKATGAWSAPTTWTCTPAGTKVPSAQTTVAIAGFNVTLAFTATNPSYESMEITVSNKGALILQAPPPNANGQCGVNSLNAVADFTTGGIFIMNSCTNFTGALTFDVSTFIIDGTPGAVSVYSPALSVLGSTMTAKGKYRIDGRNGQFSVQHKGKIFSALSLSSSGWSKGETASGLSSFSTGQISGYLDGIDMSNVHLSVIKPDNLEIKGGVTMHTSGLKGTGNANLVVKQYDGSQPILSLDVGSTLAIDTLKIQSEDDTQIWKNPIPVIACTTNDGACIQGNGGSSLQAVSVSLAYLALNPSPSTAPRTLVFQTDVQVGTIQAAFTVATAPTHYAYPVISVPSCSRVEKVIGEPHSLGLNIYMTYQIATFFQDAENPVPSFVGNVNLDVDYSALMDKVSYKRFGWTRIGYNSKSKNAKLSVTCQEVILGQIYIYGTGSIYVYRGEKPTGEMHIDEVYFGVSEVMKMTKATPKFIYGNEKKIVTIQKIGFVYGNVYPGSPPNPPPHTVEIDATINADYMFDSGAGDIFVKSMIHASLGIVLWEETKAQVPNLDIDKDSKLSIGFTQSSACQGNAACTLWFSSQADITGHLMLTNATILMPPIEAGAVHFNLFGDASKLTLGGEVHIAHTTPAKQWPTVGFNGVANTLAIEPSSGMVAPDVLVSHRSSHGTVQTSHIIEPYLPNGPGRARLALGRIHMANYGVGTVTLSGEAQAYQIADVGSNFLNSRLNLLVGSQQRTGNINVVINGILLSGKGLVNVNGWGSKKTALTIPKQITASMLVNGATVNTDVSTGGFTLVGKNAILDLQSCDLKSQNASIYVTWDGLSTFSADATSTLSPKSLYFKSTASSSNGNVQIWPMAATGKADCANPSTTKTGVAYDITKFIGKGLVSRPNTAACPKGALLPPMGAPYPPSPAEVPYSPYAPPDVPIPPVAPPTTTAPTTGSGSGSPTPPKAGKKDDSGIGSGGVAGIIIAVLVVIAVAAAAAYYFVVKKARGDFKSIE